MSDCIVRSTVTDDGTVRIAIDTEPMPEPGPDEVVVAVEAAPINPSDLGMLIAGADPESFASVDGALVGTLGPAAMAMNAARVGQPMPCGDEGAAPSLPRDRRRTRRLSVRPSRVSAVRCCASHTKLSHVMCIRCPTGSPPPTPHHRSSAHGARYDRDDVRRALGVVHTAAASNLGQMLSRLCRADGIPWSMWCVATSRPICCRRHCRACRRVVGRLLCGRPPAAITATGATLARCDRRRGAGRHTPCRNGESLVGRAGVQSLRLRHPQAGYIYGGLDRSATTLRRTTTACRVWGDGSSLVPRSGRLRTMAELEPASPRRCRPSRRLRRHDFARRHTRSSGGEGLLGAGHRENAWLRHGGRDLSIRLAVRSRGAPDDDDSQRAWMALFVSTLVVFLAVVNISSVVSPVDP